jgi:hypothetical protein
MRHALFTGPAFLLALWAASAFAQSDLPLYGRWELALEAQQPVEQPSDVVLTVELAPPSGRAQRVFGFWDGGATWRVRLLASEPGTWKYTIRTTPPVGGLDGQRGEFVCRGERAAAGGSLSHGPLVVSKSRTHLAHADGTPFFWLGDTVWNGPLLASRDDWETFLADRVAKRFSVIQFNMPAPWRTAHADERGQRAYSGRERIEMHPQFFQRMDERVEAINRHGLVAAIVLLWTLGQRDVSPGQLPDDRCVKLARYMVARYQGHHVCWILAGDENYSGERGQRWARIGRQVFPADLPRAPVTLHPQGMQWHLEPLRAEPWLDFLGYQSGHGDDARTLAWIHSGPVSQTWKNEPIKPTLNLEPPYEAHLAYQSRQPHSDYSVRRACYWSLMNTPVAGLTYGGHGIWSWQTTEGVPQDHQRSGLAQAWHKAKDLPASGQMRHLVDLMTSLAWTELRPAQELVAKQPGADDPARFISAAATPDGRQAVLYLPVGGSVTLDLAKLARGAVGEWFDPRSGRRQAANLDEGGVYQAPDERDWVLVVAAGK